MTLRVRVVAMAAVLAACAGSGRAAELRVSGLSQTHFVLEALLPMYEAASGNKIVATYEGAPALAAKVKSGALDLVIMSPEEIDALAKDRLVGPRADVFISGVGLAVKAGAPKPDIRTVEALKAALLSAKSVARSAARSGRYFAGVMERLGIAEQMKPKVIVVDSPVATAAAKGDAEIAVQQLTELMPVAGVEVVGPLPAELQTKIFYSAAIVTGIRQPEAAKSLLRFFGSKEAAPVIRAKGLEPGLRGD